MFIFSFFLDLHRPFLLVKQLSAFRRKREDAMERLSQWRQSELLEQKLKRYFKTIFLTLVHVLGINQEATLLPSSVS